jgi:ubiquinone/menaquinone biosynthesis C-methylase UbiE
MRTKNTVRGHTMTQYDTIAEQYHNETEADLFRNNKEKLQTELVERPKIVDPQNWDVLDVGCGTGIHLEFFAEKFSTIKSAAGIDQSEEMIRIATQKKRSPLTSYVVGDMDKLPFPDNSFDFIFSRNALHYSDDLSVTFAEISRVLKPEGQVSFQVNHPLHNLFMKNDKNYSKKEILNYAIQGGKTQVAHPTYTISEYVNAITSNKLHISEMHEYDGRSSEINGYTVPTVLSMLVTKL